MLVVVVPVVVPVSVNPNVPSPADVFLIILSEPFPVSLNVHVVVSPVITSAPSIPSSVPLQVEGPDWMVHDAVSNVNPGSSDVSITL